MNVMAPTTQIDKNKIVWFDYNLPVDESTQSSQILIEMGLKSTELDLLSHKSSCSSLVRSHKTDCTSVPSRHSCSSCTKSAADGVLYYIADFPYLCRTWQEEELDGELEEDEAKALRALTPKLEIPKWTEHDLEVSKESLDNAEDLSEDTFLKRHAKQELDEKRRKKWDVQQIREQRRIDKLRRRHCKHELTEGPIIKSFFPLPEQLEMICYINSLPLQAFGEPIPKLTNNGEGFYLPWLLNAERPSLLSSDLYKIGLKQPSKTTNTPQIKSQNQNRNIVKNCALRKENKLMFYIRKLNQLSNTDNMCLRKAQYQKLYEERSYKLMRSFSLELGCNIKNNYQFKQRLQLLTDTKPKNDGNSFHLQMQCQHDTISCIENNSSTSDSQIYRSCYLSPVVMLAQHTNSFSSRAQMRKLLKYSSFLFVTKRKRQQSLCAFAESSNKFNKPIQKVASKTMSNKFVDNQNTAMIAETLTENSHANDMNSASTVQTMENKIKLEAADIVND